MQRTNVGNRGGQRLTFDRDLEHATRREEQEHAPIDAFAGRRRDRDRVRGALHRIVREPRVEAGLVGDRVGLVVDHDEAATARARSRASRYTRST